MILMRQDTSPEDIEGMIVSQAIVTARGGMTSHAAVVARGMGATGVVGMHALTVDEHAKTATVGDTVLHEGDWVSVDGQPAICIAAKSRPLLPWSRIVWRHC